MRDDIKKEAEIMDNYRQVLTKGIPECPPKVRRAAQCIHEYLYNQQLTVNWMKKQCHINGKSFSAQFKACLGWYPKEYIIHHRIETSKLLLAKTEVPVTDIALAVGYASLAAYCNTFRNKEDCRPSEWRRLHLGN